MIYTIEVSNHRGVGARIQMQVALDSWEMIYEGETTGEEARSAADRLSEWYANVRVFKSTRFTLGRVHYEVLRPR